METTVEWLQACCESLAQQRNAALDAHAQTSAHLKLATQQVAALEAKVQELSPPPDVEPPPTT